MLERLLRRFNYVQRLIEEARTYRREYDKAVGLRGCDAHEYERKLNNMRHEIRRLQKLTRYVIQGEPDET